MVLFGYLFGVFDFGFWGLIGGLVLLAGWWGVFPVLSTLWGWHSIGLLAGGFVLFWYLFVRITCTYVCVDCVVLPGLVRFAGVGVGCFLVLLIWFCMV